MQAFSHCAPKFFRNQAWTCPESSGPIPTNLSPESCTSPRCPVPRPQHHDVRSYPDPSACTNQHISAPRCCGWLRQAQSPRWLGLVCWRELRAWGCCDTPHTILAGVNIWPAGVKGLFLSPGESLKLLCMGTSLEMGHAWDAIWGFTSPVPRLKSLQRQAAAGEPFPLSVCGEMITKL